MTSHRKLIGVVLALATGAATLAPAAAAYAQSYGQSYYDQDQVRRDYDARYGRGAYDRYYANQGSSYGDQGYGDQGYRDQSYRDQSYRGSDYQNRDDSTRRNYDARYGEGAYDRYYGAQADQTYRQDSRACRKEKSGNAVAGALLGGLAGAVIGSNVARGGGRTGGALIGGVAGAAGGSAIAKGTVHCND